MDNESKEINNILGKKKNLNFEIWFIGRCIKIKGGSKSDILQDEKGQVEKLFYSRSFNERIKMRQKGLIFQIKI